MFRRFTTSDLPVLRMWFSDPVLARRISEPTDDWMQYTQSNDVICLAITDPSGAMIELMQTDRDETGRGWFDLVIAPDMRGKGVGKAALQQFGYEYGHYFKSLHAGVEHDNAASIGCLLACGYVTDGQDDNDGLLHFVHP